jgi:hypothetical protein
MKTIRLLTGKTAKGLPYTGIRYQLADGEEPKAIFFNKSEIKKISEKESVIIMANGDFTLKTLIRNKEIAGMKVIHAGAEYELKLDRFGNYSFFQATEYKPDEGIVQFSEILESMHSNSTPSEPTQYIQDVDDIF